MKKYAEKTPVNVDRTKVEISQILRKFGVESFGHGEDKNRGFFMFVINGIRYQVTVPYPSVDSFFITSTGQRRTLIQSGVAHAQEVRRLWRSMLLNIKGKIVAIEDKITTVEDEFLSFVVLPSGESLGEKLLPMLKTISQTGQLLTLK